MIVSSGILACKSSSSATSSSKTEKNETTQSTTEEEKDAPKSIDNSGNSNKTTVVNPTGVSAKPGTLTPTTIKKAPPGSN